MLNQKEFSDIKEELKGREKDREDAIQRSRDIISLSKKVVYSVHRNEMDKAEESVREMEEKIKELPKEYFVDLQRVAMQEYVEAACYFEFVKNKKIPTRKELNVQTEVYLSGLCDLSGELVRKALNEAIKKNFEKIFEIKEFVEEVYGELIQLDLRNGELRKKVDSMRWSLQKLENMCYELSLRDSMK